MSTQPVLPRAQHVLPHVYRLDCPFGEDGLVYVYYLDARQPALVDTGVKPSAKEVLEPGLAGAGFRLQDVRHIFNTHGHGDHMGGNEAVRQIAPQARTYVHQEDAYLLGDAERHLRGYHTTAARLLGQGPAPGQLATFRRSVDCPTRVDAVVADGATYDLGGLRLRAVHTPGHSRGSTSYLLEPAGVLFTGDGVQGQGSRPGQLPLVFDDSRAYRATLVRLSELPFGALCLGHAFCGLGARASREPVRRGAGARQFLEESGEVAKAVEEAMRSTLRTQGDTGFLPVARATLATLAGPLALTLDETGLNLRSLPTLHAFYRELTGAALPA